MALCLLGSAAQAQDPVWDVQWRTLGSASWNSAPVQTVHTQRTHKQDDYAPAGMAWFDSAAYPVEVEVRSDHPGDGLLRPAEWATHLEVLPGRLRFTLAKPRCLSVEFGGDVHRNLHLFAGSPIDPPPPDDLPGLIRFRPGRHDLSGGYLDVPSGATVWLDAGALVRGAFRLKDVHDVTIAGRGTLSGDIFEPYSRAAGPYVAAFDMQRCNSVRIAGIHVIESKSCEFFLQGCSDVSWRDVRVIGCARWTDGIHVKASRRLSVEGGFFRTADDCLAFYASGGPTVADGAGVGDSEDISVRGTVLWPDVANALNLGNNERDPRPFACRRIRISDITVLHQRAAGGAVVRMLSADRSTVEDVRIDGVLVAGPISGRLLKIEVGTGYLNTQPGDGIRDVQISGVRCVESPLQPSLIAGLSQAQAVRGLRLGPIALPSGVAASPTAAGISLGEWAEVAWLP